MIWFMIMMIVALALIGVPMSFSMLTGSVWFMLSSGMPQTLMIQRLIMAAICSACWRFRFSCWPARL